MNKMTINNQSSANNFNANSELSKKANVGKTKPEAIEALKTLRRFISPAQLSVIADNMRGEEKQFFFDKAVEIANTINTMPHTYQTDGQGQEAIAHLHYFHSAGFDWYVTEKDIEPEQLQAFGLCSLQEKEFGYVNLIEITRAGAELDLHWTPKPLKEIK